MIKNILAVTTLAATALLGSTTAAQAAPSYDIRPGALTRGDDITVAHVEGRTVVEGSTRVPVRATNVLLLGEAGSDYIIATLDSGSENPRIWRLQPDGTRSLVVAGVYPYDAQVSDNGARVSALKRYFGTRESVIGSWSTATGEELARNRVPGLARVLDVSGVRTLYSSMTSAATGTWMWNTHTNHVAKISARAGYLADFSSGQLASYTKDPYLGGCTVLAPIAEPDEPVWRSCSERVTALSPGGRRMALVEILSDGVGPNVVRLRNTHGALVATYAVDGWFREIYFEDDLDLLLGANGRTYYAIARCDAAGCERASDLEPASQV